MPRIKHFIVLVLENRPFYHLFGFFPATAGETIENLVALHSPAVNLLDPSRPESSDNPAFKASQPARPLWSMTRKARRIRSTS
jgi:phospholipase C